MATAYVVKGYGKGYVAMNPWRYTQVSAEATSFSKIPMVGTATIKLWLQDFFLRILLTLIEKRKSLPVLLQSSK